jgi:hypothetical protein
MAELGYPTLGSSLVSPVPIEAAPTKPLFPPVCLKYHWDPTMILARTLPQGLNVPLPLDPRPWTKVCLSYVNSGDSQEQAPTPPPSMVFPSGGEFYPPNRYSQAIGNESLLRRLDRPLGTCDVNQFEPNPQGDMYISNVLVPDRRVPTSAMVQEMAMPRVLIRPGAYPCREEADVANLERSQVLFNNATKQQRYNQAFRTKKLDQ